MTEADSMFKCEFCGKGFSTKSNLKTHTKSAKKCILMRSELYSDDKIEGNESIQLLLTEIKKFNIKLDLITSILTNHSVKIQDINDRCGKIEEKIGTVNYDKNTLTMLQYIIGSINDVKNKLDLSKIQAK